MTSNPMVNNPRVEESVFIEGKPMSAVGAVNKTLILLAIVVVSAYYTWNLCLTGLSDKVYLLTIIGSIAGLILAFISFFNPKASPVTAPIYALCEGLVVGGVSYMYESYLNGIVINAAGITLLTLFTMLLLYRTKVIQATEKFRKVVVVSTFAIAIFYLIGFVGALLGHPMTIFNGGLMGIGVSLVICVIAALNFILDFDFIEKASDRVPSYFEWYAGLSLLVTVIWLYFEVLRLLAQLQKK